MSSRKRSTYSGRGYGRSRGNRKKSRTYYSAPRSSIGGRRGMTLTTRTAGPWGAAESKYFTCYSQNQVISGTVAATGKELDGTVDTIGALGCLFAPKAGAALNQRIGNKVTVYKIVMKCTITTTSKANQTTVLEAPNMRFVLYVDEQANATQSQSEDLFSLPAATPVAPNIVNMLQNEANFGRFRVLHDKRITMPQVVSDVSDGTAGKIVETIPDKHFEIRHYFRKGLRVKFNSTNGGTFADIVDNSLHLVGMKSNNNWTQQLSYICRVYYKDY